MSCATGGSRLGLGEGTANICVSQLMLLEKRFSKMLEWPSCWKEKAPGERCENEIIIMDWGGRRRSSKPNSEHRDSTYCRLRWILLQPNSR